MRYRRALLAGLALAATTATTAQAAPELSTSDRLPDRRYVSAAERAQIEGFQDGRFYANGWHITGEMGGIWTPPLKLLDGVWFGIDGEWVGPATKFTTGYGKATKQQMAEITGSRYGIDWSAIKVKDGRYDQVDALALAAAGYSRAGQPLAVDESEGGDLAALHPQHWASLNTVKWPEPFDKAPRRV